MENYADTTKQSSSGQHTICFAYGEGKEVLNFNNQIEAPDLGALSCLIMQQPAFSLQPNVQLLRFLFQQPVVASRRTPQSLSKTIKIGTLERVCFALTKMVRL